jgi:hypothetical protein
MIVKDLLTVKGFFKMVQPSSLVMEHFISKYKEEYCYQLLEHCASGRSIETFCAKINTIPEAMMYWANQYPEFEVCLRVAHWKSLAWWEDRIIEDQTYIKELKTLQPQVLKLVMENRFKWLANAEPPQKLVEQMSNKEIEERARKILEARDSRPKEDVRIGEFISKTEAKK